MTSKKMDLKKSRVDMVVRIANFRIQKQGKKELGKGLEHALLKQAGLK